MPGRPSNHHWRNRNGDPGHLYRWVKPGTRLHRSYAVGSPAPDLRRHCHLRNPLAHRPKTKPANSPYGPIIRASRMACWPGPARYSLRQRPVAPRNAPPTAKRSKPASTDLPSHDGGGRSGTSARPGITPIRTPPLKNMLTCRRAEGARNLGGLHTPPVGAAPGLRRLAHRQNCHHLFSPRLSNRRTSSTTSAAVRHLASRPLTRSRLPKMRT